MSPVDKKWYLYNDELIQQININKILFDHIIIYIPCILVYTLDNTK